MTILEWYVGVAATLLALLVYFAYFFKFDWIRVSERLFTLNLLPNLFSVPLYPDRVHLAGSAYEKSENR